MLSFCEASSIIGRTRGLLADLYNHLSRELYKDEVRLGPVRARDVSNGERELQRTAWNGSRTAKMCQDPRPAGIQAQSRIYMRIQTTWPSVRCLAMGEQVVFVLHTTTNERRYER